MYKVGVNKVGACASVEEKLCWGQGVSLDISVNAKVVGGLCPECNLSCVDIDRELQFC